MNYRQLLPEKFRFWRLDQLLIFYDGAKLPDVAKKNLETTADFFFSNLFILKVIKLTKTVNAYDNISIQLVGPSNLPHFKKNCDETFGFQKV